MAFKLQSVATSKKNTCTFAFSTEHVTTLENLFLKYKLCNNSTISFFKTGTLIFHEYTELYISIKNFFLKELKDWTTYLNQEFVLEGLNS